MSLTPEWSLPLVVVVSLEIVILVALDWDKSWLRRGNVVICDSCQSENHKWNYPTHVFCGCALDLVECRSRKQFLEIDSTLVS